MLDVNKIVGISEKYFHFERNFRLQRTKIEGKTNLILRLDFLEQQFLHKFAKSEKREKHWQ